MLGVDLDQQRPENKEKMVCHSPSTLFKEY